MSIFIINAVNLTWSRHFILRRFFRLNIFFQNKADIIRMIKHLGNGYLKKALIFRRNIIQSMCLIGGDNDAYHIIYYIMKLQWFYPCMIRNVRETVFSSDSFFNSCPIFFNSVHYFLPGKPVCLRNSISLYNRIKNNSNVSYEQAMDKVIHNLLIKLFITWHINRYCG